MKKVIGALLAASVVGGAVSADIAIKLQSRIRPSMYTMEETYAKDGAKTSTLWDFNSPVGSNNDVFVVNAKGENCGIDVEFAVSHGHVEQDEAEEPVTKWRGVASSRGDDDKYVGYDGLYAGWMNWGDFKVTIGNVDRRFINRYNETAVEGGLADSDTAKYGLSNNLVVGYKGAHVDSNGNLVEASANGIEHATTGKSFLFDFSNSTTIGGNKAPALIGEYALGLDVAKLLFRAGFVATKYNDTTEDKWGKDDINYQGAGYVAEVQASLDPVDVELVFKKPSEHTLGFGIYADLKAVEKLNAALGFTFGTSSDYDTYTADNFDANGNKKSGSAGDGESNPKMTAYAIDARAFYQVLDPLKVGLVAKFSSVTMDIDEADDFNSDKAQMGLEVIGTVQYVLNDLFTAQFDAGLYMEDLDDKDDMKAAENYMIIRPAVKFSASKQAAITAGVQYQFTINGSDADDYECENITKSKFQIPLIARIKI